MKAMLPSGEATPVIRRRRFRDEDLLVERDLLMLMKRCEGRRTAEVGVLFGITPQLVNRRLKPLPRSVKDSMRRFVAGQLARGETPTLPESLLETMTRTIKRARRGQDGVGQLQASRVG
jgi:hypothetical protein